MTKKILDLSHVEAKKFFLKQESYVSIDLPSYFSFKSLVQKVSRKLSNGSVRDYYYKEETRQKAHCPQKSEGVNYDLLSNKDGEYAWRPLQIIHPFLYVDLVNEITKEANWQTIKDCFENFSNSSVKCVSIPVVSETEESDKAEQVSLWFRNIEQKSIELAMDYQYIFETDISDCYGSIYTHSIAWAIHTKPIAKQSRDNKNLLGNIIDNRIQGMRYGQTNGIPQGSVLMDFIAEIVLGYADTLLSEKIRDIADEYKILRYRDDYRIFVNNPEAGKQIIKNLTEVLSDFGMKLNSAKTKFSDDVVLGAIKSEKIFELTQVKKSNNLQKELLLIHDFAKNFPNSGAVNKKIQKLHKKIESRDLEKENIPVLISIITNIMFRNPRALPLGAAILSKFISKLDSDEERAQIIQKIIQKFRKIPNTGLLDVWLQRISLKFQNSIEYEEILTKIVKTENSAATLWNSDWLKNEASAVLEESIVDQEKLDELEDVISSDEVSLFLREY